MIKARLSRRNGSSRLFPDVDWYFWSLFQFGILWSSLIRGTLDYRRIYFNGPLGWTCWSPVFDIFMDFFRNVADWSERSNAVSVSSKIFVSAYICITLLQPSKLYVSILLSVREVLVTFYTTFRIKFKQEMTSINKHLSIFYSNLR